MSLLLLSNVNFCEYNFILTCAFKSSLFKLQRKLRHEQETKANVFNFAQTLKENYTSVVYTNLFTTIYENKKF